MGGFSPNLKKSSKRIREWIETRGGRSVGCLVGHLQGLRCAPGRGRHPFGSSATPWQSRTGFLMWHQRIGSSMVLALLWEKLLRELDPADRCKSRNKGCCGLSSTVHILQDLSWSTGPSKCNNFPFIPWASCGFASNGDWQGAVWLRVTFFIYFF